MKSLRFLTYFFLCTIFAQALASDEVTIGLMGDVMLGRLVDEKIAKTSFSWPWGDFLPLLKKNDVNIVNLETSLTTSSKKVPKTFNFKSNPKNVETLKEGFITVANLANNHIRDFNDKGMQETIEVLDNEGILHVGAGDSIKKAQKPLIIEKNGVKIGIIGVTDNEPKWKAQKKKPGTNYIKVGDTTAIIPQIKRLRPKVDILILTIHWGPNMRSKPSKEFVDFAHTLIDAGVDIIHGHSAHIVQPIEIYKGKAILYDTGDFIDDYAVDSSLHNDHTALFIVTVNKKDIVKIQIIPGLISRMQINKPSLSESLIILNNIKRLSQPFGTQIDKQGVIAVS